jgi:hypothetical protein
MVSIQRSNPEFVVKPRYLRRNALAVALPGDSCCGQTATDFSWTRLCQALLSSIGISG